MNDLTLIIPAKYEKESLPKVLDELGNFNFKKNIILEASDKLTIEAIKNYNCRIIYQESKGYGDALKKGIETVETEFFCIFNADGSFDPKYLKHMLDTCENNFDFVFASRYLSKGGSDDDTILTKLGNFIFTISDEGYLYVLDKNRGNILRVTDLYINYKDKKRKNIKPIGFVIGDKNLYLTNSDGKMIVAGLNLGNIIKVVKVAGSFISEPLIFNSTLFVVRNGSIVQYN